jgi:hypothetical protein
MYSQSSQLGAVNVFDWLQGLHEAIDDTIKEEASHTAAS